jgi:hypothetical protein
MGDVEPPSGLGNFKGVMLCNRPEEGPTVAEAGPKPFKTAVSTTYGEQLGLNPPPREQGEVSKGTKPVNEALARHRTWVKELAAHVAETKREENTETSKEQERNQAVVSFCEKQREQVKGLKEAAKRAGKEINREDLAKAVQGKLKKPKWALTQDAVEELDEEEAVELLDFADNLNFDEYMNDLGFREGIAALKGRANKLQKEQDNFKNLLVQQFNDAEGEDEEAEGEAAGDEEEMAIEGDAVFDDDQMSMVTSHTGVSQEDRKFRHRENDWDSSTRTSETQSVDTEELEFSKRALRENPKLAKVHSEASVQKIAEKVKQDKEAEAAAAEAKAAEDAQKKIMRDAKVAEMVAAMSAEKAPPAPLIQVHVEDARCNKPVDPSMLPYLYRSPAI